jgi:histone H3/H4
VFAAVRTSNSPSRQPFLLPTAPIRRMVRAIARDLKSDARFTDHALTALHVSIEDHLRRMESLPM